MSFTNLLLLFLAPVAAGVSVYFFKKVSAKDVNLLLSFSGSYLFAITVLHLMPEIYHASGHTMGIYILIGFFFQILLEQFSKGIEHGHIHPPENPKTAYNFSILFGLSAHAFLEGIPLSGNFITVSITHPLLYGIILHKIPAAFALMSILLFTTSKKQHAVLLLLVFAVMSPTAVLLTQNVCSSALLLSSDFFNIVLAVVAGSFLHISTTILFESSLPGSHAGHKIHRFSVYKIMAILGGAGIALLTL